MPHRSVNLSSESLPMVQADKNYLLNRGKRFSIGNMRRTMTNLTVDRNMINEREVGTSESNRSIRSVNKSGAKKKVV